ncbi:hypothetical protein HN873_035463 [Arachis hypogaea]
MVSSRRSSLSRLTAPPYLSPSAFCLPLHPSSLLCGQGKYIVGKLKYHLSHKNIYLERVMDNLKNRSICWQDGSVVEASKLSEEWNNKETNRFY